MTPEEKLQQISALIKPGNGRCMCGTFESCEICSGFSAYNQLVDKIRQVLTGHQPPKPTTLSDYGRTIKISRSELEQ